MDSALPSEVTAALSASVHANRRKPGPYRVNTGDRAVQVTELASDGFEVQAKMARYNEWMNSRLYALCSEIADAERKADRSLFFGSIHSTLNHLLYGELIGHLEGFLAIL